MKEEWPAHAALKEVEADFREVLARRGYGSEEGRTKMTISADGAVLDIAKKDYKFRAIVRTPDELKSPENVNLPIEQQKLFRGGYPDENDPFALDESEFESELMSKSELEEFIKAVY